MCFQRSGCRFIDHQWGLFLNSFFVIFTISIFSLHVSAEDWPQWRGPQRNGAASSDTNLLKDFPKEGLMPVWVNTVDVGNGGGWSSPIAANGKVYSYQHVQKRTPGVDLPPAKFPRLTEEAEGKLSSEELRKYEEQRRAESIARREKLYTFFDRIVCLNLNDGSMLWEFERKSEQTRWRQSSTPCVADDELYFISADRQLVCLDVSEGKKKWHVALPVDQQELHPVSSSPLVVGDRIFVLAEKLAAFSRSDGELLWQGETIQEGAIYSSPVAYSQDNQTTIIANLGNNGTIGYDAETGRELWSVKSYPGRSTPVVYNDLLITYGASRKGGVRCYQLGSKEPKQLWEYHRLSDQGSSPVVGKEKVFVQGSEDFVCLDLKTGDEIWKTELDLQRPRYTSPIIAGDQVFYTFEGVLSVPVQSEDFEPNYDARLNREHELKSKRVLEEELNIKQIKSEPQGLEKGDALWKREVISQGPRACVSPLWVDGKLILRLNSSLVCYNLQAK